MACPCPAPNTGIAGRPTSFGVDGIHGTSVFKTPPAFDSRKPNGYPLAIVLPGRTDNATQILTELAITELNAMDSGVFVLSLTGKTDTAGPSAPAASWDAIPSCCWFDAFPVDDVAYVMACIAAVRAAWPIDPRRIWVIGHSTGGFLAHRLAAEHSDVITGVISYNGYGPGLAFPQPTHAVHVHVIIGSVDTVVLPGGGDGSGGDVPDGPYIGGVDTVNQWNIWNAAVKGVASSSLAAAGAGFDIDSAVGSPNEASTQAMTVQVADGNVWLTTLAGTAHLGTHTAGTRLAMRTFMFNSLRPMIRLS
jgi:polyhydroxybutyrate depolymerase